jgi:hypothetical protein
MITAARPHGNAGAPSFAAVGAMRRLLDRLGQPGATANAAAEAARRAADEAVAEALAARLAAQDGAAGGEPAA